MLTTNKKNQITPLGTLLTGQSFGITANERIGNLYMLGRTGTGKSVVLENIIFSDLMSARGGMLIDPYGDLIAAILPYVPAHYKNNLTIFNIIKGSAEQNIKRFEQQIN
ncbi:MAG: hypothetical protein WCW27_04030 [Patescibacteria group bacterium]|jgi:hypothetical protein